MSVQCPLAGVKQTSCRTAATSASDPKRTSRSNSILRQWINLLARDEQSCYVERWNFLPHGIVGVMKRREFLGILGAGAVWPRVTLAQQNNLRRIPVVGFIGFSTSETDSTRLYALRKGLTELGYVEGRNITIDARSAGGDVTRGLALIDELIGRQIDVFVSPGPATARSIVKKTKIPVVAVGLPVQNDPELFQSLSHPGGSLTGFAAFGEEISAKRIEMLREILPGIRKLGVMHNASDPTFRASGAQSMSEAQMAGVEPIRIGLTAASPAAVTECFKVLAEAGGTAMIVIRDFMTAAMEHEICRVGIEAKVTLIGQAAEFARAGALFSYGADGTDLFRRAATYVDSFSNDKSLRRCQSSFRLNLNWS